MKIFFRKGDTFKGPIWPILCPKRPIYGPFATRSGKSRSVEPSSRTHFDDTRSVEPSSRVSSNGSILEKDPIWVKKDPFMVHLPQELKNLWEKSSQVGVYASSNENHPGLV